MNKSFTERHPNITSVVSVVVWFVFIALLALCTSCKGTQNYVEIVKWDTLHVYHTDTIREIHNDTIREKVVITIHDSIIKQTIITNVVNEQGDVVHTEKETNNEVWHNADTSSSLIQHTVDSLLQAKMDSIYNASHEDKPVVVEVEKPVPWYSKVWNWIVSKFAWIGLGVLIIALLYYLIPKLWKW